MRRENYIWRVFPKLIPDWLAPLLLPICRPITLWPARNCSSLKCRAFFSDSFGPMLGWPYCPAFLPRDCKQMTTELRFCRSHKSTVWNVSWAGTPRSFAASKNAFIFSMHLKAILLSFIFFTAPGLIVLAKLQTKRTYNQPFGLNFNYILAECFSVL